MRETGKFSIFFTTCARKGDWYGVPA